MKRTLLLLSLICFLSINLFGQAIPKQFDYQGVLKDASGTALNGDYGLTFRIYNEPTGGTALWSEIQVVNVNNGLFNAHLGSNTPISGVPFDRVHFLGIQIGTEAELTPRTMLTPSPYSFMSMDIMDEAVTTTKIHDDAVTGAKIGSSQVVKSLNGIKDDVTLVAGTNITLTPSGNNITINAAGGGGGGTVTQVNTGAGLTGGPITTTGTISISNDGITSSMLQSNSVTSAKIADGTIATADLGDNSVTSAKIVDGTIATADLGNNSVTSAKIVDATITAADIGATQVVKALNNLKDNVTLVAGTNVTITPSGNNLTIAATSSGVGGSGTISYLPKFTSGTMLGNSIIYETNGKLGIGTTIPTAKLQCETDGLRAGYFTSNYLSHSTDVLRAEYTGVGEYGGTAIVGVSTPADGYGKGGYFKGGQYGILSDADAGASDRATVGVFGRAFGSTGSHRGVYGTASQGGTSNYGVAGGATGGTTNYGVYGSASGGTTSYGVYASGNLAYTGTLINLSDIMFKQNINSFSALSKITQLEPRVFNYTLDSKYSHINLPSGSHYGLIAQELEKVFPELVSENVHPSLEESKGEVGGQEIHYKGVSYVEFVPVLIQAVKEQQKIIEGLTRRLEELERR